LLALINITKIEDNIQLCYFKSFTREAVAFTRSGEIFAHSSINDTIHHSEIFQVTGYYSCTQTGVNFSFQNQECSALKLWWQICTILLKSKRIKDSTAGITEDS